MADLPFDRCIINPMERPLSDDINQAQAQLDRALRDVLGQVLAARFNTATDVGIPATGFLGAGLRVVPKSPPPGAPVVTVSSGLGYQLNIGDTPTNIAGVHHLDDLSTYKPLYLSASQDVALDAAPAAGNERYDIIEVLATRTLGNPSTRDVFNALTEQFDPTLVQKTLSWDLLGHTGRVVSPASSTAPIGYKVGVAAPLGTAAVPATTSGYVRLAVVYVATGTTNIVTNLINDTRRVLSPGGVAPFALRFSMPSTGVALLPTLVDAALPPGVRVAVVGSTTTAAVCFVYLFAGSGPAYAGANAQADDSSDVSSQIAKVSGFATGVVDGALQTLLADATRTAPALAVAVGQAYAVFIVHTVNQIGGTTNTAIADPTYYNVTGQLRL